MEVINEHAFYPPPRVIVKLFRRKLSLAALMSSAVFLVFTAFFAPNAHAATSGTPTPPVPSTGQGPLTPNRNPTLFAQEKQQLSLEYNNKVLKGKETVAAFEQHDLAFMHKWNLGGYQYLHKALTTTRNQSVTSRQKSLGVNLNTAYVSAVQFPEEQLDYCGNATVSTVLVEDSFKWSGTTFDSTAGLSINYDPYVISQPQNTSQNDEDMLGMNYLGDYSPGPVGTVDGPGTTFSRYGSTGYPDYPAQDTLNDFVSGKGGWYNPVLSTSSYFGPIYRQNLNTDSAEGWDIADAIQVPYDSVVGLPGWAYDPNHVRQHWIASTYTPDGGNTSEIADPVYNAPGYGLPDFNQSQMSAHEDVNSSIITVLMTPYGYFW